MPTTLMSPFFLRPFARLILQPGAAHKSTFPTICVHSRSCRRSILEDATFHRVHRVECASSFEVILAGQSKLSSTGTLSSRTSGSRCFSFILPRRRARRGIRLCRFCTLSDIVTETAIVTFGTLTARWLSTANNLQEFFVHAVLSPDS